MRFIHAADIHLDSPLVGLERYESAPTDQIRGATRQALVQLVDLSISEEVSFVLIAGDLYDGDWRDYNTGLFYIKEMVRLQDAGIRVLVVSGNHDAQNRRTRGLPLPDNVTVIPADEPHSVELNEFGVVVHGQSSIASLVPDVCRKSATSSGSAMPADSGSLASIGAAGGSLRFLQRHTR